MKKLLKPTMQELAEYKMLLQRLMLIVAIVLLLVDLAAKTSFLLLSLFCALCATFFFFFMKDFNNSVEGDALNSNVRIKQFRIYCYTMAVVLCEAIGGLLWNASFPGTKIVMLILILLTMVMTSIFVFGNKTKLAINDFLDRDFYAEKEDGKRKPGDAQIGVDKETGDPIILPLKDRYLHMLVLGPTGCGKTSQVLTPMVKDDIANPELGVIVLEPKGDFAERVYALAKLAGRDNVVYFNPTLKDCPYFNPLMGKEDDVIENIVTTFKSMDSTSSTFFQDNNENLLRRSLKLLKRLYGNDATFVMLDTLINNVGNQGKKMVEAFDKLPVYNERIKQENRSISDWFLNDYYTGISGERGSTKTYEQTSGVRNQIAKLISNSYLNRVLNPPKSSSLKQGQYVDFDGVLANGGVLAMCSAQGDLRDLGSFLGYFIILTLQSSVFRRPGNENTRRGVMLYIDEFQKYSNAGFADMLTQGRSYRVASILATQNRALIGMNNNAHEGQAFTQLVSTNARNVVIFPGANAEDAKYYSTQFGEDIVITESHSESGPAAVPKWLSLGQQHATTSYKEERKARISATDISYKVFGEAVVSLIVDNTLQRPRVAKLSWIPADLNKQAQEFIDQFMERQKYSSDIFTPESIPAAAPSLDLEDSDAPVANDDNLITLNPDMGGGAAEKPNSTPPAPTSEGTLDDVLPGDDLL